MNDNTKEILKAIDGFQRENYKFHIETHRKQSETNGRLLGAEKRIEDLQKVDGDLKKMIEGISIPNLDSLKERMLENYVDLKWIKRTYWIVVSASMGTLITLAINLILNF